MCVCVCVCVRACVCACARACVCVCVCDVFRAQMNSFVECNIKSPRECTGFSLQNISACKWRSKPIGNMEPVQGAVPGAITQQCSS